MYDELPIQIENYPTESCSTNNKEKIANNAKLILRDSEANEFLILIEKLLGDTFRQLLHDVRSEPWSIVNNAVAQVIQDVLRKEVIEKILNAQLADFFDTNAAADRMSES